MFGLRVIAPPIKSEPHRFNIVDQAWAGQIGPIGDAPGEWANELEWRKGIKWRPLTPVQATAWDPTCGASPGDKPAGGDFFGVDGVDPFAVTLTYECTLPAGEQIITDEWLPTALYQLEVATPKALEEALWSHDIDTQMLTLDSTAQQITGWACLDSGVTVITGDQSATSGFLLLSKALADCGAGTKGTVYAPSWVVEVWIGKGLVKIDEDGYLVTGVRGDRVIAGAGFDGSGPNGATVTGLESWIYATGPVELYLEDIGPESFVGRTVAESLDRATNHVEIRVERMALLRFDPACHFGVKVDASLDLPSLP